MGRAMLLAGAVSFLAGIAPLSGCAAQQEARSGYELCNHGVTRTSDGILRVCAQLNQQTIASVQDQLKPSDSEILLTSGGGTSADAMRFADLVNARGLTIRTRQFCLSACATYVLLTARTVVVEPYTMVAFHHTGAFVVDFFADRSGTPAGSPARTLGAEERRFFAANGLDPDILYRLAAAVEPTCTGLQPTSTGQEGFIRYRYAWFIPTHDEAQALFRGRLSGYWPASRREAESILRPTLGEPGLNIAFGWPASMNPDPAAAARALPSC